MRYVIYGAGGIGGSIGARLFLAGYSVLLIARGEHGRVLREAGLRFITPETQQQLEIETVEHPRDITWQADDLVLLTMKSQHTVAALEDLETFAPADLGVVCCQNGVANERAALRRFARTYGMLINLPASHLEPGEVVNDAVGKGGILDTGRIPSGVDATVVELTEALTHAGFSAVPAAQIMRQKYAKLLMNLGNSLQAAVGSQDGVQDLARQLRKEALACYAAAGIDCATRDEVRARADGVYRMAEVPGFERQGGSSWQSIKRGTGNIETDYLNGEIVQLGRLHGVPTPANVASQIIARRLVAQRRAPESVPIAEFQELVAELN